MKILFSGNADLPNPANMTKIAGVFMDYFEGFNLRCDLNENWEQGAQGCCFNRKVKKQRCNPPKIKSVNG